MARSTKVRWFCGGYREHLTTGELDTETGEVSHGGTVAEAENASFLVVHPSLPVLYAVRESSAPDDPTKGGVVVFRLDVPSAPTPIATIDGCAPGLCHAELSPAADALYFAAYAGSAAGVVSIDRDGAPVGRSICVHRTGSGTDPVRQTQPHPHAFVPVSRDEAYLCDLGTDEVVGYTRSGDRLVERSSLEVSPGSGPRHLVFDTDGACGYLVNELSNTICVLRRDGSGELTVVQTLSTLSPDTVITSTAAEIAMHPTQPFLYVSNRGENSIVCYRRDPATRLIEMTGRFDSGGEAPRHFSIDPTGRWMVVANRLGDRLVSFRLSDVDGLGRPTGSFVLDQQPACVVFAPQCAPQCDR